MDLRPIRARTLFATHYHELTRLSGTIPLLANAHMAVETDSNSEKQNSEFRFLYLLKEGAANESFGIHVAKLAGLPKSVIERAWKVLDELERTSITSTEAPDLQQLPLFLVGQTPPIPAPVVENPPHPIFSEIEKLNPNEMTPLQALNWLAKLQEMSRGSGSKFSSTPSQ